jgi:CxxC motif-containing protein
MNHVAVKTDRSVSNEQADRIEEAVHRLKLKAPVRAGEVLFLNVGGTGVHLIAVRAMRQRR